METRYGLAIETLSSNLSGGTSQYSSMDRVSPYEGLDAGSTPTTGSICHDSSIGRAHGSYPCGFCWFDPDSWHHSCV